MRTIFKYRCSLCGWTGQDIYPDGPHETVWFAIGDENLDACPICREEYWDDRCVTNLETIEVIEEEEP